MHIKKSFGLSLLGIGLGSVLACQVSAQTFTTLHNFTATSPIDINSDGATPESSLILVGITLYGTANRGGSDGRGTVFALNTDGAGFTNLHSFSIDSGAFHPVAGLLLTGTTLYGTTLGGGNPSYGTVFAINSDGTGYATLNPFTGGDGQNPVSDLILSSNTLYGTTQGGGNSPTEGSVFALTTNGMDFADLYNFSGSDGSTPVAGLTLSNNTLYGTASSGGSSGGGTVFAVNTDGTGFTNLYSFTGGSDGGGPSGDLILQGNTLYGTTAGGGRAGNGTVFAVNTDGTGFTNLYSFVSGSGTFPKVTNSDGVGPSAGLILRNNTLYGTTVWGGSSANGTVFAISTDGTGFKVLHSFTATSGSPGRNTEGANPRSSLLFSGNTLYGTASAGGTSGNGTVFSISLPVTQPQLSITASGAAVLLTWPTNFTGFTLQSTTNIASPWTTNSAAPVVVNGLNTVTTPLSGTQQFFRLSQ